MCLGKNRASILRKVVLYHTLCARPNNPLSAGSFHNAESTLATEQLDMTCVNPSTEFNDSTSSCRYLRSTDLHLGILAAKT